MKIKTLIIDDEYLARQKIRNLLKNDGEIEIVGESEEGKQAVADIIEKKPDLVFLDVQMPELNGFEVLKMIGSDRTPNIIFVTAYDQYALKAFEVHAFDFLLKPFTNKRFKETLDLVKQEIQRNRGFETKRKIQVLIDRISEKDKYLKWLMVKKRDRIKMISTSEIDWIEASKYNMNIHVSNDCHQIRRTMKELEKKLDPETFIRIHRSFIVNIKSIKEIRPWFKGEYMVVLKNGTKLTISKSYQKKVFHMFDH